MTSQFIKIDGVQKSYTRGANRVHALRDTNLNVDAGEFIAIIGPSGSGKTTLLSILGGMLAPTTGEVILDGDSLYQLTVRERSQLRNRKIGFLFQSFNLVPWLSALENVQLPLSLYGLEKGEQKARATELLERYGLADRLDHKPSELSAGQQQRVAMSRTLVMNPQLILADEPTGNLDPNSRDLVLDTLEQLSADGRTILLVTHDPHVSDRARRVFQINDGVASEEKLGAAA